MHVAQEKKITEWGRATHTKFFNYLFLFLNKIQRKIRDAHCRSGGTRAMWWRLSRRPSLLPLPNGCRVPARIIK